MPSETPARARLQTEHPGSRANVGRKEEKCGAAVVSPWAPTTSASGSTPPEELPRTAAGEGHNPPPNPTLGIDSTARSFWGWKCTAGWTLRQWPSQRWRQRRRWPILGAAGLASLLSCPSSSTSPNHSGCVQITSNVGKMSSPRSNWTDNAWSSPA